MFLSSRVEMCTASHFTFARGSDWDRELILVCPQIVLSFCKHNERCWESFGDQASLLRILITMVQPVFYHVSFPQASEENLAEAVCWAFAYLSPHQSALAAQQGPITTSCLCFTWMYLFPSTSFRPGIISLYDKYFTGTTWSSLLLLTIAMSLPLWVSGWKCKMQLVMV